MPTTKSRPQSSSRTSRSSRLSNHRTPQSREECAEAIAELGRKQREAAAIKARADDEASIIQERLEEDRAPLLDQIAELEQGIESFCAANRDRLTDDGKTKTVVFATGEVKWRFRPPKVSVRGTEAVLAAIKDGGKKLGAFMRVKEEINKDAMQADPDLARTIRGVSIKSAGEDFVIEPTEIAEVR